MSAATAAGNRERFLEVRDLTVQYPGAAKPAVRGVSFGVEAGECLALVGESGSGKSTIAAAIGRLTDLARAEVGGSVRIGGREVLEMDAAELSAMRRHGVAYVFQEPASSLNPVMRVEDQLAEALWHEEDASAGEVPDPERILRLLKDVQIQDPERVARSFPHELSGGMQQRIMIAMALAKNARILVADEPTTALDATVQREILRLMIQFKLLRGMSILFVTHDLQAARQIADRMIVLRGGVVAEELGRTPAGNLAEPRHPYSRALMSAALLDGEPKRPLPVEKSYESH